MDYGLRKTRKRHEGHWNGHGRNRDNPNSGNYGFAAITAAARCAVVFDVRCDMTQKCVFNDVTDCEYGLIVAKEICLECLANRVCKLEKATGVKMRSIAENLVGEINKYVDEGEYQDPQEIVELLMLCRAELIRLWNLLVPSEPIPMRLSK